MKFLQRSTTVINGVVRGFLHWVEKEGDKFVHFVEFFDRDTKSPLASGKGASREKAWEMALRNLKSPP